MSARVLRYRYVGLGNGTVHTLSFVGDRRSASWEVEMKGGRVGRLVSGEVDVSRSEEEEGTRGVSCSWYNLITVPCTSRVIV